MSTAKRRAAEAAAELVEDGMRLGLGTGSTVAFLLPALARRGLRDLRCIATSDATAAAAAELGIPVEPFDSLDALDLTIDGADEVAPDGWLVKGGGGAHVRERIAADAAARFVVIVSDDKVLPALRRAVPLELLAYGLPATLRRLPGARVREGAPPSPDGGVIADLHVPIDDPAALAARLEATPGVVGHGLFPPAADLRVLVGREDRVELLTLSPVGPGATDRRLA
jgi:ribose 5-phosphate isomerase A